MTTPDKPRVSIADLHGDAFRLILRVAVTLSHAGQPSRAVAYWHQAMPPHDYGKALKLAREYVEVTM